MNWDPDPDPLAGQPAPVACAQTPFDPNLDSDWLRDLAAMPASVHQLEGDRLWVLAAGGLVVNDVGAGALTPVARLPLTGFARTLLSHGSERIVGLTRTRFLDDPALGVSRAVTRTAVARVALEGTTLALKDQLELPGNLVGAFVEGDVLTAVSHTLNWCPDCPASGPHAIVRSFRLQPSLGLESEASFPAPEAPVLWRSGARLHLFSSGAASGELRVVDLASPVGAQNTGAPVAYEGRLPGPDAVHEHGGALWAMTTRDDELRVTSYHPSGASLSEAGSYSEPLGGRRVGVARFAGSHLFVATSTDSHDDQPMLNSFALPASGTATPSGSILSPRQVSDLVPYGERLVVRGLPQGPGVALQLLQQSPLTVQAEVTLLDSDYFSSGWPHRPFVDPLSGRLVMQEVRIGGTGFAGCEGPPTITLQVVDGLDEGHLSPRPPQQVGIGLSTFLTHQDHLLAIDSHATLLGWNQPGPIATLSDVRLASATRRAALLGAGSVRVLGDSTRNELTLATVAGAPDQHEPAALGTVSLASIGGASCEVEGPMYTAGSRVWFQTPRYDQGLVAWRFTGVDVSDPAAPALVEQVDLPIESFGPAGTSDPFWVNRFTTPVLAQVQDALLFSRGSTPSGFSLQRLRLAPGATAIEETAIDDARWVSVVRATGPLAYYTRMTTGPGGLAGRDFRFFLHRLDLSGAGAPAPLAPVEVPGEVVALDASGEHAAVVRWRVISIPTGTTTSACAGAQVETLYDVPGLSGECALPTLRLVSLQGGQATLRPEVVSLDGVTQIVQADDRIFLVPWDRGGVVRVVHGLTSGQASVREARFPVGWWEWKGQAAGARLALTSHGATAVLESPDQGCPRHVYLEAGVGDAAVWSGPSTLVARGPLGVDVVPAAAP